MNGVNRNALTLTAYSSGSTPIAEPALSLAEGIEFNTLYPAGLFGSLSFYVPRDVTGAWLLSEGQRIKARNGLTTVWEGRVTAIEIEVQRTTQGSRVTAIGYWGDVLMPRNWPKPWADTKIDDGVWVELATANAQPKCEIDRLNRIRFTPKAVAWLTDEGAVITYTMPTGETVKQITFAYDLQEAGQQWQLEFGPSAGVPAWTASISGTGTQNITLGTPVQSVRFVFRAKANQTPASDGTIYAQVSNVVVYTETSAINLTEIAKDVRAKAGDLSTYEDLIATNAFSLVPFISEADSLADILTQAAAFGDAAYNSWAVGVRESDLGSDDRPVLFAEAYPLLTDYDYAIRLDEKNVIPPFSAVRDISDVRNWISVAYHDESGRAVNLTPDDDATLKDTTSITAYGERHELLRIDTSSTATATNYARRVLAARKDPQWRVTSDIQVVGFIRGKTKPVAASEIRAGKRVKIENFFSDLQGSGLTLLITGTSYTDSSQTCRLSVGRPDSLDVWLAQTAR